MQSNKYYCVIESLQLLISSNIFGRTNYLYIFIFTPYRLLILIKFYPIRILRSFFYFSLLTLSLPDPILIHKFVDSRKFV